MSLSKHVPKMSTRLDSFGAGPDFEGAHVPPPRARTAVPQLGPILFVWLSTGLRVVVLLVVLRMGVQLMAPSMAASPIFAVADLFMHPFEVYAAPVRALSAAFHWSGIAAIGSLMLGESLMRIILRQC